MPSEARQRQLYAEINARVLDGNITAEDRAWMASLPPDDQAYVQKSIKDFTANGTAQGPSGQSLTYEGIMSQLQGSGGRPRAAPKVGQPGAYISPQAEQDALVRGNLAKAERDEAEARGKYNEYTDPWMNQLPGASFGELAGGAAVLSGREQNARTWQETNRALDAEGRAIGNQAIGERNSAYGRLMDDYAGLNRQTQSDLGTYLSETNPLMERAYAGGYGAAVQFDPEGLAMQRKAAGMGQDIYGGSLDYTAAQATLTQAKLERARSNPQDVQAQREAAAALRETAGGALDAHADPEAIAAQKKALAQFEALSKPEVTAEERFIYEQSRRNAEQTDLANRQALLEDMGRRGVRSGAAEIANLSQSRQQIGEDRVLAELGAQSTAVQRAQRNLESYAGLGSDIRQQSFGENNANNDRRFMGEQAYADITTNMRNASDNMSMFNANEANDISMFNAGQANQVSMFNANEQNEASANNQATRLGGAQIYATQANEIRRANDDINKFNKEQSLIQQRFQDDYTQRESERLQGLARDRAGERTTARTETEGRIDKGYTANTTRINSNETTGTATVDREKNTADKTWDVWDAYGDQAEEEAERPRQIVRDNASLGSQVGSGRAGVISVASQPTYVARNQQLGLSQLRQGEHALGFQP